MPRSCYRPFAEPLETRLAPATLPPGFSETVVVSGLSNATALALAPDGKIFVAEQAGTLEVWQNGTRLQENFFADTPLSVQVLGERGLIGIALDPQFAVNRFVYVHYTATTPTIHNRVSRFTANAAGDRALPGSEVVLLELDALGVANNHNGGAIHFGPDGKLYIAVGDNANPLQAQSLDNLFGKLLRINPDGTIPQDNPFFNIARGKNQAIWALGLRNPFTFAIHRSSGRVFINDVGQDAWEEINEGSPGANFNWPASEGPFTPPDPNPDRLTPPVHAYHHNHGGCAITGGTFYDPETVNFPLEYVDNYFFADFCGGWIERLNPATGSVTRFAEDISYPVDLRTGSDGSLYYLAHGSDQVFRVRYTGRLAPTITQQPQSLTVPEGRTATFTVRASGMAPLRYQWQRQIDNVWIDLDGAVTTTLTLNAVQATDNGAQFRVVVSNEFGSEISLVSTLTVTSDQPPTVEILEPPAGTIYRAGDTIAFAATARDHSGALLPASAFTWRVDFHHDDHVHPFLPEQSGFTRGSFEVPTDGETDANVFYRIILTVTDAAGRQTTVHQDVLPRVVTLGLTTNPSGLELLLDGQPQTTPLEILGVTGIRRTLGVIPVQESSGIRYQFTGWSHGGDAVQELRTPEDHALYVANFRIVAAPDAAQLFLAHVYAEVLGRVLDPSGRDELKPVLDEGQVTLLAALAQEIVNSVEYRTRLIRATYQDLLGRAPTAAEFAPWLQQFQRGLTPEGLRIAVLASQESFLRHGADNGRWLEAVYRTFLGRSTDASAQPLLEALNRGTARQEVARTVHAQQEAQTRLLEDLYPRFLDRQPVPDEVALWLAYLNQPTRGPNPVDQVPPLILGSAEFWGKQGGTEAGWVAEAYRRLLEREADPPGFDFFVTRLLQGRTTQRQAVARLVTTGHEARSRLVARAYAEWLGRPGNVAELAFWVNKLQQGATVEQVYADLLGSEEHFRRNGTSSVVWLNNLYRELLGRDRQTNDIGFLNALQTGSLTRGQVAAAILASGEYRRRLVLGTYLQWLGRLPAEEEWAAWAALLEQGLRREHMTALFLGSSEYFSRL